MNKKQRLESIKQWFHINKRWSVSDISHLVTNRNQWRRDIKALIEQWSITLTDQKWVYEYRESSITYLAQPFFERKKIWYSYELLETYIPNKTYFLNEQQRTKLLHSTHPIDLNTNYYKDNKKKLENILIDISFSSSSLEWNTYSYLDTEVLIKYAEVAEEKAKEETRMILNHKKCIEYLIYNKNTLPYAIKTLSEVHTLLADWLLEPSKIWVIRNTPVDIWWSQYTPLWVQSELRTQVEKFLQKLQTINNPREQSFFCLVFLPYFQSFADVNKRTSRMIALLPLLKNNLPLISFIWTKKKDYITAILAIYELHDTSLLANIYTTNYLKRHERY